MGARFEGSVDVFNQVMVETLRKHQEPLRVASAAGHRLECDCGHLTGAHQRTVFDRAWQEYAEHQAERVWAAVDAMCTVPVEGER